MRRILVVVLCFGSWARAADPPVVPPKAGKSETIALFNGKDTAGWEGYADHWKVENGEIVGKNTTPVAVSTYLLTKRNFTDFHLKFDAKLVESEMHSGVAFWGAVTPNVVPEKDRGRSQYTYSGHLVMFPSGWGLYDLFGRNGLKCDTAPAKKAGKQHDWNAMEIYAQGNRIRHIVNGILVVDWRDPEPQRIKVGPIGLQLHSNKVPQEVRFRGLTLTTFPDDKKLEGKKVGDRVE
ncbi:MAG: DUF1080 domain-containing protein [Gemmataceae bacterium]|nr:DUF1080 domain-containing protein [Gemmataceae bacterium]